MLGTVTKAARVLSLFGSEAPEWGVSEAARRLEMPKSSAHSLMDALAATGLLERTAGSRYRLGRSVLALSRTLLDSSDVIAQARPVIDELTRRFGVTVNVASLSDGEVLYMARASGARPLPSSGSAVGHRRAPHSTALGKVLLAHAAPAVVDAALADGRLRPLTAWTVTSPEALRAELAAVQHQGYARSDQEAVAGLRCYAAPIFSHDGRVEAAVSVSVSVADDDGQRNRCAGLAMTAAPAVTRRLCRVQVDASGFGRRSATAVAA